jgi:hypothetical protein
MSMTREYARALIAAFHKRKEPPDPYAAHALRRLAAIDYANFLQESPHRSPDLNEHALERALIEGERAVALGLPEDDIDSTYRKLRQFWLPRLCAQSTRGLKNDGQNCKREVELQAGEIDIRA